MKPPPADLSNAVMFRARRGTEAQGAAHALDLTGPRCRASKLCGARTALIVGFETFRHQVRENEAGHGRYPKDQERVHHVRVCRSIRVGHHSANARCVPLIDVDADLPTTICGFDSDRLSPARSRQTRDGQSPARFPHGFEILPRRSACAAPPLPTGKRRDAAEVPGPAAAGSRLATEERARPAGRERSTGRGPAAAGQGASGSYEVVSGVHGHVLARAYPHGLSGMVRAAVST